jgi:hypothetical protein
MFDSYKLFLFGSTQDMPQAQDPVLKDLMQIIDDEQ